MFKMIIWKLRDHARRLLTKNRLRVSTTTGFFRNDVQMATLVRLRPDARRVYVFGCSDGCESYSFAIHFRLNGGMAPPRILSFDISEECLERAKAAIYDRRQLDYYGTGESFDGPKRQFFVSVGGDKFRVTGSIAGTCSFALGSVLDEAFMSKLPRADIVLCQNVLIHLSPEQNRLALAHLKQLVGDNGLLAIGGMRPELRSQLASRAKLVPVIDDCRVIHDGWRDMRGWWEESAPWAREYFALEPFEKVPGWQYRYSSIFRVTADRR